MNNKDLIDETGWTLTEIINRINSLPHIKQKITQEDLQNMSKGEFQEMIIGPTSSTERSSHLQEAHKKRALNTYEVIKNEVV